MKIAVIGATGFIGRCLCEACVRRGDQVTALVRNPDSMGALQKIGASAVLGELSDMDALRRTCSDADVVFNMAGALGKWRTTSEELEYVNVRAAESVVTCAADAGAKRVVHASTAGVSGPLHESMCASEDYPPGPVTPYQRTKLEGERAALRAHSETRIPLVIVRPAFVYGPGDTHKLSLFRAVAAGRMVLVNGGVSRLHPAYVDDVVHGMICAAERAPGHGDIYILGGEAPAQIRDILSTIAWALSAPAPSRSVSEHTLITLARMAESVGKLVGKEPPLTRSRVKLFSEHYAYYIDKAREEIGFRPAVSLTEGISRTANWYFRNGLLPFEERRN